MRARSTRARARARHDVDEFIPRRRVRPRIDRASLDVGFERRGHGFDRVVAPVCEPVRVGDASHVARGEVTARFGIEEIVREREVGVVGRAGGVSARGGRRFRRDRSRADAPIVVVVLVVVVVVRIVVATGRRARGVDGVATARSSTRARTHARASTRDV